LTAHDLAEVPIKQAAIAAARRTIAVCDSSKFARTGLGHVCPISDLDAVVTDPDAPSDELDNIRAAGVEVVTV
ncbi:decarboxylase, partial [Actinomadura adrarensis]